MQTIQGINFTVDNRFLTKKYPVFVELTHKSFLHSFDGSSQIAFPMCLTEICPEVHSGTPELSDNAVQLLSKIRQCALLPS